MSRNGPNQALNHWDNKQRLGPKPLRTPPNIFEYVRYMLKTPASSCPYHRISVIDDDLDGRSAISHERCRLLNREIPYCFSSAWLLPTIFIFTIFGVRFRFWACKVVVVILAHLEKSVKATRSRGETLRTICLERKLIMITESYLSTRKPTTWPTRRIYPGVFPLRSINSISPNPAAPLRLPRFVHQSIPTSSPRSDTALFQRSYTFPRTNKKNCITLQRPATYKPFSWP
jgi:hypothetical protein